MPNNQGQPTKAEVQTTKLNKLPLPGKFEPEFSAEEAAEVLEKVQSANSTSDNQE